jgi:hypothetical protein
VSTVIHPNGRPQPNPQPRKQLSDQLDRFDQLLDGLAEGLNEAIADAAREGTRQAVQQAILEILTNPELRAAISGVGPVPTPSPVASPRSVWARVKALWHAARAAVATLARTTRTAIGNKIRTARSVLVGAGRMLVAGWRVKQAVLATAVLGVAVGVGGYYLAPHANMVLSGAAGAFVALTVRVAVWVRTTLRIFLPA